jgi:hypothetical protein
MIIFGSVSGSDFSDSFGSDPGSGSESGSCVIPYLVNIQIIVTFVERCKAENKLFTDYCLLFTSADEAHTQKWPVFVSGG